MFSYLGNNRERGPFGEFDSLQREMEQLFGGWSGDGIRSGRAGAYPCLLYTSPSPRDRTRSRMPSSA